MLLAKKSELKSTIVCFNLISIKPRMELKRINCFGQIKHRFESRLITVEITLYFLSDKITNIDRNNNTLSTKL